VSAIAFRSCADIPRAGSSACLSPSADLRAVVLSMCEGINADTQPLINLSVLNKIAAIAGDKQKVEFGVWAIEAGLKGQRRAEEGEGDGARIASAALRSRTRVTLRNCAETRHACSVALVVMPRRPSLVAACALPRRPAAFDALVAVHGGKYCVGDSITLADVCLVPQLGSSRRFPLDLSQFPNLLRIEALLADHPAFIAGHPNNQADKPADIMI
jgi:hypothetical protein